MKKKFCNFCGAEHWHNPMKKSATAKESEYRCVNCGNPKKSGKNVMIRLVPNGKVMAVYPA